MTAARRAHAAASPRPGPFTGTGHLVRLILRVDRVRLPAWVGGLTFVLIGFAASLPDSFADASERQARATLMSESGTRAISGPGYGLEDYTYGAILANEGFANIGVLVALMAVFLVVRHTRGEEAARRAELIRAAVIGRHAPLAAALAVTLGAVLTIAVLATLGIGAAGLEGASWPGVLLFGAGIASIGVVFAAVACVCVQLTEHPRGASALAGVVIALAYVARAAGDAMSPEGSALSWFSPFGWAHQTRAFVDDRWWPLLLAVLCAAALVAVGARLSMRRDLGAGVVPPRPGPAEAADGLSGPFGLTWRLRRSGLATWTVVFLLIGLGFGVLTGDVVAFMSDVELVEEFFAAFPAGSFVEHWMLSAGFVMSIIIGVFGVLMVLRMRAEEAEGRAEPVLATEVSPVQWMASHLAVALGGTVVLLLVSGVAFGLSSALSVGDMNLLGKQVVDHLRFVPGVWATVGVGAALFGLAPRALWLVWLVVIYADPSLFIRILQLPDLPEWMMYLSPYAVGMPTEDTDINWLGLFLVLVIALGLLALGLRGFRNRDLRTKV